MYFHPLGAARRQPNTRLLGTVLYKEPFMKLVVKLEQLGISCYDSPKKWRHAQQSKGVCWYKSNVSDIVFIN